jgi:long-chain acyl-CoA synthetase
MSSRFLFDAFEEFAADAAIVWRDKVHTYAWLLSEIERLKAALSERWSGGATIALVADYSPRSVAALMALESMDCIVVPIAEPARELQEGLIRLSHADGVIRLDDTDRIDLESRGKQIVPPLYAKLREERRPGLVLFTSGTSGQTKVAVHSMAALLGKFRRRRHRRVTITLLLYDHIGGVNTLFYTLSNGGTLVTVPNRQPETVAHAIERHHVELLPASPTFLNLLLLSGVHKRYDLGSLRLITYGTERMPDHVLQRLNESFPGVQIQQTYGTSEIGILRSKSESSSSTWVRVGGPEFEKRILDGVLHVKAESAMLGYVNAASPFTEDGWFVTGDRVEQKGDYLRFLGRDSDMINSGGVNVHPAEVENVLLSDPQVAEVRVYGRPTDFGTEVSADVRLRAPESVVTLLPRLRRTCAAHLSQAKVPTKINVAREPLHSARFKMRQFPSAGRSGSRIGFVVSGQGPSWPRTGTTLLVQERVFRTTLEEFDSVLGSSVDWSLLAILTNESRRGELDSTEKGQPAHFAFQVGLARLWAQWGYSPSAVIGHSMGEVAAGHIAGALSFEDAVRIVLHRAAVTQGGAGKGKMATVSLPMDATEGEIRPWSDRISVCAYNEPQKCVVAGETKALQEFTQESLAKSYRVSLLPFDYAFHSPLMRPLRPSLVERLQGIRPNRTSIPMASTVRGRFVRGEALDPDYWGDNICEPVRFVDGVNLLMDAACDVFLEIGPHSLLVESVRDCLTHRGYEAPVFHSLRKHQEDLAELHSQREALTKYLKGL